MDLRVTARRWWPAGFALAFVATGLALSLRHAPLGDLGVEADFFAELGSPGGASKVGLTENDPQSVKDLPPKGED